MGGRGEAEREGFGKGAVVPRSSVVGQGATSKGRVAGVYEAGEVEGGDGGRPSSSESEIEKNSSEPSG